MRRKKFKTIAGYLRSMEDSLFHRARDGEA